MKRLTLAALGALALIGSAGAADLRGSSKDSMEVPVAGTAVNWSGIHIGGQIGYGVSQHNLSATGTETYLAKPAVNEGCNTGYTLVNGKCYDDKQFDENGDLVSGAVDDSTAYISPSQAEYATDTASSFINGIGGDGLFAGGSVGFDYARGNFLIGAFADYNFSESKADAGINFNDYQLGYASIKEGDSWMIGARAGYLFGHEKRAMLYGLIGFGQTDVKYAVTGTTGKETTFDSLVIGIGGEYALTNNLFFGIEARKWLGDEKTLASYADENFTAKITDDFEKTEVMARLRYKFNVGISGN